MKNTLVIILFAITVSAIASGSAGGRQTAYETPEQVSFPTQDDGIIYANLYGKGDWGVVLAHGGRFTKESWEKQAQALVKAGFRVLAIDFRGRGQSRGGPQD
jgi:pimeloyl-ACP methyl ester carboxylesterase